MALILKNSILYSLQQCLKHIWEVSVYIIAVPKKRSKFTTKAKEQLTMLEKEFEVSNYLNNKAIANLIKETGLTKP